MQPQRNLQTSCWRAWLHLASLVEERGDLPGYPLVFLDLAVVADEVREQSAAVAPFLRETPTLTLGCLTRFLLGKLAGTGFCLRPLLTLALFLGLARGLGLQPAALGREPLLLGSPLLLGGLFPGKLLGALTLEALALGALLGFPPGPGLPLFFCDLGTALGPSDLTAHQVAAVGIDGSAAVLLAHLARRIHRRPVGSILRFATAAGREYEEEDDGYVLVHGSPFRFGRRAAPELREFTSKRRIRAARPARCDTIPTSAATPRASASRSEGQGSA